MKKDVEKFREQISHLIESVKDDDWQIVHVVEKRLIKMYEELEDPQEKPVIKEWKSLSKEEKDFVLRVSNNQGVKYGAEPHFSKNSMVSLWENPEKLGFIQSVGSYKFVVTDKYKEIENILKGE